MSPGVPTKIIAAICGLSGFAVALIAGIAADNPADTVLTRAIVAMLVLHILGWIIGSVGERTVVEALAQYKKVNPIPEDNLPGAGNSTIFPGGS